METYSPIPYDYREMISEIISRMDRGKIFYFDDQNVVDSCEGRPVRLEERSAEGLFLVLDSGKAIRADRLITVFGKPGPAYDEYDAFANACLDCTGGYDL